MYGVQKGDMKITDKSLQLFNGDVNNLSKLKQILENSQNNYAKFLATSAIKQLMSDNWLKIPSEQRQDIKIFLLSYISNVAVTKDKSPQHKQFLKMIMLTLAKIEKLGWFSKLGNS